MNVDNIPVVGKIHRTLSAITVNFILLAMVCLILAVVIPFYPEVLSFLVSAMLIITAIILLNMAYQINASKKKYFDWMKK